MRYRAYLQFIQIIVTILIMKFIVSDESVNEYGFSVRTAGIEIPDGVTPMFWEHRTSDAPLGSWRLWKEDNVLYGEPTFDEKDEFAMKLKSKVESGIIKNCSIALYHKKFEEIVGGVYVLTESVVREVSLCNYPANQNAHVLLNQDNSVFELSTISMNNQKINIMKLGEILNLSGASDDAIAQRVKELVAVEQKYVALSKQVVTDKANALVDVAIKEGKIGEASKPTWVELATKDYDCAVAAIASIVPKIVKLSQVPAPNAPNALNGKTFSQLSKENPNALIELRKSDFERFNALYRAEFFKDYKA